MAQDPDRYAHGHHPSVVGQHARRTAERDAAYLLPRLTPGTRLLDVGCGPGTITTGLARAVAPGEVVGIDVVPAVLDQARAHLAESGLANVRFEEASVYSLPYADASFDAAHAHQVFHHLTRPVDASREILRVLRPGGVFGVREVDYATMSSWPREPQIDRWVALFHAVAARNGADADAGRRLSAWLREAGFAGLTVTATTELFATPEQTHDWGYSWAERIVASSLAEQAIEYGLATPADLAEIASGWRRWADDPDAFFMYVNVECIGVRPAGG